VLCEQTLIYGLFTFTTLRVPLHRDRFLSWRQYRHTASVPLSLAVPVLSSIADTVLLLAPVLSWTEPAAVLPVQSLSFPFPAQLL
jgi:hypothetical protein